jgi:hypothetical protein
VRIPSLPILPNLVKQPRQIRIKSVECLLPWCLVHTSDEDVGRVLETKEVERDAHHQFATNEKKTKNK